jgi:hypothetical protein
MRLSSKRGSYSAHRLAVDASDRSSIEQLLYLWSNDRTRIGACQGTARFFDGAVRKIRWPIGLLQI